MKMMKPLAVMLLIAGVSGCASKSETPKLDYQSQNNKIVSLEVPPDLNDPRNGELYSLPEGTVARPDATTQRTGANGGKSVLMQVKNAHIERSGTQRWLVVQGKTANEMWPVLRSFWQEMGFTIASEEPQAGLMETEWAENRAKLPNQGLRRLFDMVGMGGIYTTSERDKFLIRMERNRQGGLDIFFTHKGLEEVYSNKREETTMWQPRANDPNLEAAFLALAISEGIMPPTINYENPDPLCDLDYVPNKPVERDIEVGMSSSLGFGGHNAVLAFRKYK